MGKLLGLMLVSMRPHQWVKNGIVFVALFFSHNLSNLGLLWTSVEAFVIFCLASGGVYLLNDLLDLEKDRRHPEKCHRPLASGGLSPRGIEISVGLIFAVALGASYSVNPSFSLVVLAYLLLQAAYSLYLKNVVILDIFCIAGGFFLRVVGGAKAIEVPISSWLLICTIFISLFLGLGKRRYELILLGEEAPKHRTVFTEYNISLLDQMISVTAAGTMITYSLYTFSRETVEKFHTEKLWLTIPIVLYGLLRYLFLVYRKKGGGHPESTLFEDKPLLLAIAVYAVAIGLILYS